MTKGGNCRQNKLLMFDLFLSTFICPQFETRRTCIQTINRVLNFAIIFKSENLKFEISIYPYTRKKNILPDIKIDDQFF